MNLAEGQQQKLVTLNRNGFYEPTNLETGMKAEFYAVTSRYVVRTTYHCLEAPHNEIEFHGNWYDRQRAETYANSCDGTVRETCKPGCECHATQWKHITTQLVEVPEYWYVPGFGVVQ